MTEQLVALPSGVEICHETFGSPDDPTVLLVMGLGGPMGWWSTGFCELLASHGFHVVRFDNRDTGRSTSFREQRVSRGDVVRAFLGVGSAPYSLGDMADDAFGLMDALGVMRFHVCGVSMGGMIAQTMAIAHPERVLSLTSIMSTTGSRLVGWQHPRLYKNLLRSAGRTREEYVAAAVASSELIGSPSYPPDADAARLRAEETYDRGWHASGVLRHMAAVLTQPDRTAELRRLDVPTVVVHGSADPMVHRSGGRATAAAVPGADLWTVDGMAHDLPPALYDVFVEAIERAASRAVA